MYALVLMLTLAASPNVQVDTVVRGSIEASLKRKAPKAGAAIAAQVARLLRWRGDVIKNVHRNDRLRVLFKNGPEPELLSLDYRGKEIRLKAHRYVDAQGIARYFTADGEMVEPLMNNAPVPNYVQITEVMQSGRGKRRHHGIDLKADRGAPIILPYDATVQRVNWSTRRNGNCVEVRYAKGELALFLHLDSIAKGVRPGARLKAGDAVGAVGSTGRSSAPHLHYEVRNGKTGEPIAPLKYHGTRTHRVSAARLKNFEAMVGSRETELHATRGAR